MCGLAWPPLLRHHHQSPSLLRVTLVLQLPPMMTMITVQHL